MKTDIFEPNNPLIKLKNIEVKRNNNYTNFSYVEGGRDSEISFYFQGSELEIISDLCWNRSNNIKVQIDDKEYRYNQQSQDIKSNKIYYKRTLINLKINNGLHFVKICLDDDSTRGKDKKYRFTVDTIRCNGKIVDGIHQFSSELKIIKKDVFNTYLESNEQEKEELVVTDDGNIYIVKGKNILKCNNENNSSNNFDINSLPEF